MPVREKIGFNVWAPAVILGVTFLIFLGSLNDYLYTMDDWAIIAAGHDVVRLHSFDPGYALRKIQAMSLSPMRQADWVFWLANYALCRTQAFGYYLGNLLFHLLNAFLFFRLLNVLFGEKRLSFAAALIFAIHPVNSIAVVNVSSRPAAVCALFYLASLLCFCAYVKRGDMRQYLLSVAFAAVSFLSKEVAVVLPFSIMLAGWYLGKAQGEAGGKRRWLAYIPYFLILCAFAWLLHRGIVREDAPGPVSWWYHNLYARGGWFFGLNPGRLFSLEYLQLIPHYVYTLAVFVFEKFILAPWDLCRYFGFRMPLDGVYTVLFLALCAFAAARLFLKAALRPAILLFGFAWVLINAFPLLGTCTDVKNILEGMRHLYIISFGYSIMTAWVICEAASADRRMKAAGLLIGAALIANLGWRTMEYTGSLKYKTVEARRFVRGFEEMLPSFPENGNVYFLAKKFDHAICSFLFSDYPSQLRSARYYCALSGTDVVMRRNKAEVKRGKFVCDPGFDARALGERDMVIGWDYAAGRLRDLTPVFRRAPAGVIRGGGVFELDAAGWRACAGARERPGTGNARVFECGSGLGSLDHLSPVPVIIGSPVQVAAAPVRIIEIELRIEVRPPPAEARFAPGRVGSPTRGFRYVTPFDSYRRRFISPLEDNTMSLAWMARGDDRFTGGNYIVFPVTTDGMFHTYRLFPGNCAEWLESGDIVRFGLSAPLFFDADVEVRAVRLISG